MARKKSPTSGGEIKLNERAQRLLKTLVEQYIRDGQPVGSKTLSRDAGLDVSSATIRNVMSQLEALGLVTSPHTSAGRIPTAKGYRVFIDSLLLYKAPGPKELAKLKSVLEQGSSISELMESVTATLSEVTQMAGVVLVPRRDYTTLKRIEFLRLEPRRVLAILVINEKEIQNRVIDTVREFSQSELQQAANYLNTIFAGKDMGDVRRAVLEEMRRAKEQVNVLMQTAIEMAGQVFDRQKNETDVVLAGQTNLMHFAELSNLDKLRKLFQAFNEKRDILHLLDECLVARSIQVFVGEESGFQAFDDLSVVTAPYAVHGRVLGVLGVIGPTRMAYDKVIPLVDVTAKMLGSLLNSEHGDPTDEQS